jgi:hypothetical protein
MKMDNQVHGKAICTVVFAATLACSVNASAAVDVEALKGLAREHNCFKGQASPESIKNLVDRILSL